MFVLKSHELFYSPKQIVLMKRVFVNLLRSALVLGAIVAASASALANYPSVLIKVGQGQRLQVEIQQLAGKTEVALVNALEETVFQETVGANQRYYAKTFNLANLETGEYTFVVRTSTREIRQPFSLQDRSVALDSKARREVFLPQIRLQEDAVEINLLNRQVATVRVSILTREGELVYEDVIPNVVSLGRRYNVSHLEDGEYTFVVRTPEREFYQNFQRGK